MPSAHAPDGLVNYKIDNRASHYLLEIRLAAAGRESAVEQSLNINSFIRGLQGPRNEYEAQAAHRLPGQTFAEESVMRAGKNASLKERRARVSGSSGAPARERAGRRESFAR